MIMMQASETLHADTKAPLMPMRRIRVCAQLHMYNNCVLVITILESRSNPPTIYASVNDQVSYVDGWPKDYP